MKPELKIPACPRCNSQSVFQAASAKWDPFILQWSIAVLHGDMFCGDCEHEFTITESWKAAEIAEAELEREHSTLPTQ